MPALHYLVEFKHIKTDLSENNPETEKEMIAIFQKANLECEEVRFSEGSGSCWVWNVFGTDFQFRLAYEDGQDRALADLFVWKNHFKHGSLFNELKKFFDARDFFIMEMKR